jgi:hypothetical protein
MSTKLADIKNPIFKENTTDPTNGRTVKSIWLYSKYNHGKSEKWDLRWQYYRDRNRTSVFRFFKDHKGRKVRIIYSGDPKQYEVEIPLHSDMIDCTKVTPIEISSREDIFDINNMAYCTSETIIMKTSQVNEDKTR